MELRVVFLKIGEIDTLKEQYSAAPSSSPGKRTCTWEVSRVSAPEEKVVRLIWIFIKRHLNGHAIKPWESHVVVTFRCWIKICWHLWCHTWANLCANIKFLFKAWI